MSLGETKSKFSSLVASTVALVKIISTTSGHLKEVMVGHPEKSLKRDIVVLEKWDVVAHIKARQEHLQITVRYL